MSATFDVSELKAYRDALVDIRFNSGEIIKRILNNVVSRLLREVKRNTPVGVYDTTSRTLKRAGWKVQKVVSNKKSSKITLTKGDNQKVVESIGKQGGTLRRGWQIDGYSFSNGVYEVKVVNNTHYASYVEDGHRIVRNKVTIGWVPGVFMLKISEDKIRAELDNIIELELKKVFSKL